MNNIELARLYYEKINLGELDEQYFALFADDVEIFYPKIGFLYGKEGVDNLGKKIQGILEWLRFDLEKFRFSAIENRVIVEGYEHGKTLSGVLFPDNKVGFGKFCNVFEFEHGKISKMHCHLDPDHGGEDLPRVYLYANPSSRE